MSRVLVVLGLLMAFGPIAAGVPWFIGELIYMFRNGDRWDRRFVLCFALMMVGCAIFAVGLYTALPPAGEIARLKP